MAGYNVGSIEATFNLKNNMAGEVSIISAGLQGLELKAKGFGTAMATSFDSALGKIKQMPTELKYIGAALSLAVTAPLLAFGKSATTTFSTFDDAMRQVQAVTSATGTQFASLTELAREMGETTSFKASEAASAMNFLGMAGFDANEIISALPATLSLARAGVLDLGSAADIMSNVMTIFSLNTEDAAHVADVLAKVAHTTNTNVLQLGEAMSYAGPVAATFGMSMEMTAAAMGMLGNAGIQASMAGTTLRGILQELVAPTKASMDIFSKYGLTLADLDPKVHSLDAIFRTLKESGMSDAEMFQIFGQRAGPGLLALLNQGIDKLGDYSISLDNVGGYAENAAKTMDAGFGGAIRRMNSALESFSITIGGRLAGLLSPFVTLLTSAAAAFADMNVVGQDAMIVFGLLAIAIGPVILALAALPMIVTGVTAGLTFLGLTFSGVLATLSSIALPIAAVVAGLYLLESKTGLVTTAWQLFSDMATIVWDGLKGTVSDVVDFIGLMIGELADMFNSGFLSGLSESILSMGKTVSGWLSEFTSDVHTQAEEIRSGTDDIIESTETVGDSVVDTGNTVSGAYSDWGQSAWTMRDDVVNASEEATTATQEASTAYTEAVADMIGDVNTTLAAGIDYMAGVDIDDLRRGIRTVNDELIILNDSNELVKVSADGSFTVLKDMGMLNFETTRGGLTVMTDGIDESGRALETADKVAKEFGNDVIIVGDSKLTTLTGEVDAVSGSLVIANDNTMTWNDAMANSVAFDFIPLDEQIGGVKQTIEDTTAADEDLNGNFIVTDAMPFGTLHGNLDMSKAKIEENTGADETLNSTFGFTNTLPFGTLFGNLITMNTRTGDVNTTGGNTNKTFTTLGSISFSSTISSLGGILTVLGNIYTKAVSTISKLLEVGSASSSASMKSSNISSTPTSSSSDVSPFAAAPRTTVVNNTTNIQTVNTSNDSLSAKIAKAAGL